ncbi:MAG: DUF2339 domain-containing protein [Bryobacteraceae bacterium]
MSPQEPWQADLDERLSAITDALARMVRRQERIEKRLDRIEQTLNLTAHSPQPVASPQSASQGREEHAPLFEVQPVEIPIELTEPVAEPVRASVLPPPLPDHVIAPAPPAAVNPTSAEPIFETRFGLNWVNRVAVITLIIGVAFFFKYAVDNQWIGAGMRVALGVAAGMAALSAGEWMSMRNQKIFARGMTGLGLGLLYLSFYASYGFYDLLSLTTAFLLMTLTTAAAGGLAYHYDSAAVAVLGLIGGFLTPVVLSSGEDRIGTLTGYTLLLSLGALLLGRLRRWPALGYLALAGTHFLYAGWASRWLSDSTHPNAFLWLTLTFALFFAFAKDLGLALLPLNALAYFAASYFALNDQYHSYMGLFTAALGALHAVYAFVLSEKQQRQVALATAAALITFAVPIQFSGYRVTIAWAIEGAACAWLVRKLDDHRLEFCSGVLLTFVGLRLLFNDASISTDNFWSVRLLTFAISAAAFWVTSQCLQSKEGRAVLYCAAHVIAVWGLSLEVGGWARRNAEDVSSASATGISVLLTLWAIGLIAAGAALRSSIHRLLGLGFIGVVILKLYLFDVWQLSRVFRIVAFLGLGAMLLLVSYLYSRFKPSIEKLWRNSGADSSTESATAPNPPRGAA